VIDASREYDRSGIATVQGWGISLWGSEHATTVKPLLRITRGLSIADSAVEVMVKGIEMHTAESTRAAAGKYLTFALGSEEFGLEILKVREIIGYMPITAVPQTPFYVKGVINLRGQVIPVVDLRAKFAMTTTETTSETCIIVVETTQGGGKCNTGIVVDRVRDVLDVLDENIEDAPNFGAGVDTECILGMGKIGDSVKILLDIDRVLGGANLASLSGAAS